MDERAFDSIMIAAIILTFPETNTTIVQYNFQNLDSAYEGF